MSSERIIEILENNDFGIHDLGGGELEIETWTGRGVDVVFGINDKDNVEDEFKNIVDNFNIDEEIEVNRQNEGYRGHFSLRESVEDFEEFKERLEEIKKEIETEVNMSDDLREMKEFLFENGVDSFSVDFRKNKDVVEGVDVFLSGPFAEKSFSLSLDEFLVGMEEIYNRCE